MNVVLSSDFDVWESSMQIFKFSQIVLFRFLLAGILKVWYCLQVVDEDLETGKQVRRFLAYDLMLLMGENYLQQPFEVRVKFHYLATME